MGFGVKMVSSFFTSFSLLRKDKYILSLSIIPSLIGMILFYFLGDYFFTDLHNLLKSYISSYVDGGAWISTLLSFFLGILFFFIVAWTFFLTVSTIASPFNDLISERVEKKNSLSPFTEQKFSLAHILSVLKNEVKKILFILFVSIISLVLGLFFPPISFIIQGLLVAVTFLDYSWARHNMSVSECVADIKKSFVVYLLSGIGFMFLISIPIVNVIFLPVGVIHFTNLFIKKR